jgi:hypothetical protein
MMASNGDDLDTTTPTAPFHQETPRSPASPKPRKDSKNIFSNFGATKSSSRLANVETSNHGREGHNAIYANNGGGSTPDLGRPVHTPVSDGKYFTMVYIVTYADWGQTIDPTSHRTVD